MLLTKDVWQVMTNTSRFLRTRRVWLSLAIVSAAVFQSGNGRAEVYTSGTCSPVVVSRGGATSIDIRCQTKVVNNFTYQLDSGTVTSIAAHYSVTDEAVRNFFLEIDSENVPPYLVAQRLEMLAVEIRRLRQDLAAVSTSSSSALLWSQATKALDDGKLDVAIQLQEKLIAQSAPALESAFATIIDAARVRRGLGQLYVLKYRYSAAVGMFKSAVDILPNKAVVERARLQTLLAEALYLDDSSDDKLVAAAQTAVSSTNTIRDKEPELNLRALGILMKAQIAKGDPKAGLALFNNQIVPLIGRDEMTGSAFVAFCFACAGKAFIDLEDFKSAKQVLERGVDFMSRRITPERVSLASIYLNLGVAYDALGDSKNGHAARMQSRRLLSEAFPNEDSPDFVYLYMNEGRSTADGAEKEAAYRKGFSIASRLLPYTNGTFNQMLDVALEPAGETLRLPNGDTIRAIYFDPKPDYYDALYAQFIENVRGVSHNDREVIAGASNHFAERLFNQKGPESLRFYEATTRLYTDDSKSENFATANFMAAELMDVDQLSTNYAEIERRYLLALGIYASTRGNMSQWTRDTRVQLVKFYARQSNQAAANSLISSLIASASGTKGKDLPTHIAELRAILAKTRSKGK